MTESLEPPQRTDIDPSTRAIFGARWTVGQLGVVAGTIPYLQAVLCEEAQAKADADPQLGYAILLHRMLYAQNLAVQIASIMDNNRNSVSLHRVSALHRCRRVIADEVYRYAASGPHRVGGSLSRERFDDLIGLIARRTAELRAMPFYRNVEGYRNRAVAHMTIDDYRTSFTDMIEVAHNLFHVGDILQSLFKNGVDQRNFTGLYQCHLLSAIELYGLTEALEQLFTQMTIGFRPRS